MLLIIKRPDITYKQRAEPPFLNMLYQKKNITLRMHLPTGGNFTSSFTQPVQKNKLPSLKKILGKFSYFQHRAISGKIQDSYQGILLHLLQLLRGKGHPKKKKKTAINCQPRKLNRSLLFQARSFFDIGANNAD